MYNLISKPNLASLLVVYLLLTLQGCKKEETTSSNNNSNNKTIVKYEIVSPVPTLPDSTLSGIGSFQSYILYANGFSNGSGGLGAVPKNISYSVWTKEVDITSEARPFGATLGARGYVPVTSGVVAFNIYVNGVLKANVNAPIREVDGPDSLGIFDLLQVGGSLTYRID